MVIIVYFLLLRWTTKTWINYPLVILVGLAFLLGGTVHFVYVAIEVILIGCLVVAVRNQHVKRAQAPSGGPKY